MTALERAKEEKAKAQVKLDAVRVPSPKLSFNRRYYYLDALLDGSLTAQEQRSEYSRLRSVANKRIARLKATGYDDGLDYFPKIKDIGSADAMGIELSQVVKFLYSKKSSTAYQKARHVYDVASFKVYMEQEKKGPRGATLAPSLEEIYKSIGSPEGMMAFREFWKWLNSMVDARYFPSDKVVQLYGELQRRHVDYHDLFNGITSTKMYRNAQDIELPGGVVVTAEEQRRAMNASWLMNYVLNVDAISASEKNVSSISGITGIIKASGSEPVMTATQAKAEGTKEAIAAAKRKAKK